jgi:hypothetical protein
MKAAADRCKINMRAAEYKMLWDALACLLKHEQNQEQQRVINDLMIEIETALEVSRDRGRASAVEALLEKR